MLQVAAPTVMSGQQACSQLAPVLHQQTQIGIARQVAAERHVGILGTNADAWRALPQLKQGGMIGRQDGTNRHGGSSDKPVESTPTLTSEQYARACAVLRYAASMDDSDYLRLLTRQAEQANNFLSNARKWERERWVCQRLLDALNQPYRFEDFASGQEPPDVLFREANFEVFFVLDQGRRLNDEWREELQRRRRALSLSQLLRREPKPRRIPPAELQARLAPTLRKKAHNYSERGIDPGELDLLAYVNLKRETPDFNGTFPPPSEFLRQGWRSLSLVGPNYARVLFAHADAPAFLRRSLGRTLLLDVGISL